MNSNLEYVLGMVTRNIPIPILQMAFCKPNPFGGIPDSLEHRITTEIIDNWLKKDCDQIAGIEMTIPLSGCVQTRLEGATLVEIPYNRTGGSEITSVLSIVYGYDTNGGSQSAAGEMVDALFPTQSTSTSEVRLIGNNSIVVTGTTTFASTFLRCVVSNEAGFANIKPRSVRVLGRLAIAATKAYIYRELDLQIGESAIINGISSPKIAERIESYSDQNEIYEDLLKLWPRVAFQQDRVSHSKYLRQIMGR